MPPKQRFNKTTILETALKITRESGFEAVNARSLAAGLNCSTAPVYSYYANMDDLKTELYDYAVDQFMDTLCSQKDMPDFLERVCQTIIHTASQDSNMFRFIYLSQNSYEEGLYDFLMKHEAHRLILARLRADHNFSFEQGCDVFYKIWFLVFGISALLSANKIDTPEEEILTLVREAIHSIVWDAKHI